MSVLPTHPIYIPSKGRADRQLSARMFTRDGVPFQIVVEPQEVAAYEKVWPGRILSLPENGRGLVYSRNWIRDYSRDRGEPKHWQFDDDVRRMVRVHEGRRLPCASNLALVALEDFVDLYENVPLASFNSQFFVVATGGVSMLNWPPFYRNARCYTNFLMLNSLPTRWRGRYNEDTDMTLQVLAAGFCTILMNAFTIDTPTTETAGGGQADIYKRDGRLDMARELERRWPGIVRTGRRFGRPQHIVKNSWKSFDQPLIKKADPPKPRLSEADFRLIADKPLKSPTLKTYVAEKEKQKIAEDFRYATDRDLRSMDKKGES